MSKLKLEVGKTYINRDGEFVKILYCDLKADFPFKGDDSCCYMLDGKWLGDDESDYDLIAEAPRDDLSHDALVAFSEYAIALGNPVVIYSDGEPEYEITVRKLK